MKLPSAGEIINSCQKTTKENITKSQEFLEPSSPKLTIHTAGFLPTLYIFSNFALIVQFDVVHLSGGRRKAGGGRREAILLLLAGFVFPLSILRSRHTSSQSFVLLPLWIWSVKVNVFSHGPQ